MANIFLVLVGSLLGYLFVYNPKWLAICLFTFIIAEVNFEINALPLNFRAILSLLLFVRVLFTRLFRAYLAYFFSNRRTLLFLFFYFYVWLVSYSQDLFTMELFKQSILVILSCIMLLYFLSVYGKNILGYAILLAGIICFSDLVFTYVEYGTFPIRRAYLTLYIEYVSNQVIDEELLLFNHNFFGLICGIAFVYLIYEMVFMKRRHWIIFVLLLLNLMGVFMSTSRSALFSLLVVACLLLLYGMYHAAYRRQSFKIITYSVTGIVLAISLYSLLGMYFDFEGSVLDEINFRLVDEPLAVMRKALGYSYNLQNLGSLQWREEAASSAYQVYMHLTPMEQLFGIGYSGFLARNLGDGLNPHNGILIMLIQYGVMGFMVYLAFLFSVIPYAVRTRHLNMALPLILFVILYSIGQNDDLTSGTFFLFTFFIIHDNLQNEFEVGHIHPPDAVKLGVVAR